MAKKFREYADSVKRRYEESDFGDENLGYNEFIDPEDILEDQHGGHEEDDEDNNDFDSAFDLDAVSDYDENEGFSEDSETEYYEEDDEDSSEDDYDDEYYGPEYKETAVNKFSGAASGFMSKMKDELQKSKEKKPKKPAKKKAKPKPSKSKDKDLDVDFSGSAFDIDEEEEKGLLKKVAGGKKKTRSQKEQNRKDILSLMNIPETFVIDEQYYLPDDLKNIEFSYEAPMGFSVKEVERFFNSVVRTIRHYVDLLHKRNEHIVELAGKVDEKDDVIKKLRYEQEIAQGINVVPTQGDIQLENELTDAKLEINRLKRELKQYENTEPVGLEDEERDKYNELQDEYSVLVRQNDELKADLKTHKLQILKMEEDSTPDINSAFASWDDTPSPASEPKVKPKTKPKRGISAFSEADDDNGAGGDNDYDDDDINNSLGIGGSTISVDDSNDDDNAFSAISDEGDDDDYLDRMMNEDKEEQERRSDRGIPTPDNPFL